MATITINIPATVTNRVIDGFCRRYSYREFLDDQKTIPNPETKAQFAKRKMIEFIKAAVKEVEMEDAKNAAATTAGNSVDQDIVLT